MDALWDWGPFDGCFGTTRIRISDVDGIVERNGHILLIEAKPPGKTVSKGQAIMFDKIAESGFFVLILWGETNKPEQYQVYRPKRWHDMGQNPSKPQPITLQEAREFVRGWFAWANLIGPKASLDRKFPWPRVINDPATANNFTKARCAWDYATDRFSQIVSRKTP